MNRTADREVFLFENSFFVQKVEEDKTGASGFIRFNFEAFSKKRIFQNKCQVTRSWGINNIIVKSPPKFHSTPQKQQVSFFTLTEKKS